MATKTAKPPLLLPAPSLLHSGVRTGVWLLWFRLTQLASPVRLLVLGAIVYFGLSGALTVSFFWPRAASFSYAEPTCFTSPMLLPDLVTKKQSATFSATPVKSLSVAGHALYSQTTCISAHAVPAERAAEHIVLNPLGIGFLKKDIRVTAGTLPSVSYRSALSKNISTQDPLTFSLNQTDRIFAYQLLANGNHSACTKESARLVCGVGPLKLEQSASYTLTMQRLFGGKAAQTVFARSVSTVGAVQLNGSSITAGQTILNAPGGITLTLNKPVRSFDGVELYLVSDGSRQKLTVSARTEEQKLVVDFAQPLARSASFELQVKNISALDGGRLPAPLVLNFATSGGPKVRGINIGSYKVSATGSIVIRFDSAISASQNLNDVIKLSAGGAGYSLLSSGSTVTIRPTGALPGCTHLSVTVLDGLQNEFGVSGGSAWEFKSRTVCQTSSSIGTSVRGRGITAYSFGSGGSVIVFVGGTHGNEKSSVYTLNSWLDYLERNYDKIPSNRRVVVIPNLNPDGFSANSRTNANNVDLNRNFPANNWKQGVTMPDQSYNPNGGGSAPLSEPESSAVANYLSGLHPRLVLTYHAAAGVAMPNDSGDSGTLAQAYDQKSNVNYEPSSQTGAIFTYDTGGSMEEWLHDKHDIPAILVELWTKTSDEFSKNQNAMWYMVQLP